MVEWMEIFMTKNGKRKSIMQAFVYNNARFCYQSKVKVLSAKTFRRMQIWTKKDKNGNLTEDDFKKSSSVESASKTDNDSNDETESDYEKDGDETNE